MKFKKITLFLKIIKSSIPMYTKTNKIFTGISKIENFIEGSDVYNSLLLLYLNDPSIEKVDYEIFSGQYRPDLIAKDFYGDYSYESFVILQAALPLAGFKRGTIIQLIPKETLDSILSNI